MYNNIWVTVRVALYIMYVISQYRKWFIYLAINYAIDSAAELQVPEINTNLVVGLIWHGTHNEYILVFSNLPNWFLQMKVLYAPSLTYIGPCSLITRLCCSLNGYV